MRIKHGGYLLIALVMALVAIPLRAHAQTPDRNFKLQVTPSPLVDQIVPGQPKTIEMKITNQGNQDEQLKMGIKNFTFDSQTGQAKIEDNAQTEVSQWLTFADPLFTVKKDETFTQKIQLNPPQSVGFSYTFAIIIERQNPTKPKPGQKAIEGQLAVFSLLSVDKPGASRKFQVVEMSSEKRLYEWLPTTINVKLKNVGNTIALPAGNVFIQRSETSQQPISVLPLNPKRGYLLPDTSRVYTTYWTDGFPAYVQKQAAANTNPSQQLKWDFSKAGNFRFGHYVAKVVAIYNDGQRDVPVEAVVGFWVIPWKLLLVLAAIIIVILIGFISFTRQLVRTPRRRKAKERHEDRDEA